MLNKNLQILFFKYSSFEIYLNPVCSKLLIKYFVCYFSKEFENLTRFFKLLMSWILLFPLKIAHILLINLQNHYQICLNIHHKNFSLLIYFYKLFFLIWNSKLSFVKIFIFFFIFFHFFNLFHKLFLLIFKFFSKLLLYSFFKFMFNCCIKKS